jgi:hypothetical protein
VGMGGGTWISAPFLFLGWLEEEGSGSWCSCSWLVFVLGRSQAQPGSD